jgi:hypothetical protein
MVHLFWIICCYSPNSDLNPYFETCIHAHCSEWYTYFEQFDAIFKPYFEHFCIHAHSSEWYTYFEQFAVLAPIRIWPLTSKTLPPCPQLWMVHLLRTIWWHSPNTDFKPYFEHFCIHAHRSEWCTYFEHFAVIAPMRIWTLTSNTLHPCPPLRMVHLLRTICCLRPNTDFKPLLRTLFIHGRRLLKWK